MRISEIAADQSAGRAKNIMHVGAPTTVRAARLAEHAAKSGVEAICCVPPFFYQQSDESIVEHYRVVAAAADLPLFVYNLPGSTGVEITPDLMRKIQDGVPQLKGLKHSAVTFGNVGAFADMGLDCFIGNSLLMLPAMTIGATGCVDGPPNMAPELWVDIWDAYKEGDLARAEAAQRRASKATTLVWNHGFPSTIKAVLSERLGIDCGDPRPPGRALTPTERSKLLAEAAELGLTAVAVGAADD
jgi:4-hydroxy-tetrahydrodipicolinate synthase